MTDKDQRQADYLANRLARNLRQLRSWIKREAIEACRLYDRDIPEIPLAIDRYGVGSDAALVLYLYQRPYEKPEDEESAWLALMSRSASKALDIDIARIFVKTRQKQRGLAQYERMDRSAFELVVREADSSFIVNLSDYLDTGLFLDHRSTRALVRSLSAGKRVLNLFSYTGSFTVHALAGGATEAWSVDLSTTYLAWASRNLEANGFTGSSAPLVREDVAAFLSEARAAGRRWDLIVVDPPTFSNSKRAQDDLDIARDWPRLVASCLSCLEPQGQLLFSTNSRSLDFDPDLVAAPCKDISASTIPPDFRNSKIHRAWLIGG